MNFIMINQRVKAIDNRALALDIPKLNEFKIEHAKEIYKDKTCLKLVEIIKQNLDFENYLKSINDLFYKDPSVLTRSDSAYVVFEVINILNTSTFINCDNTNLLIKLKYTLLQAFSESFKHLEDNDIQIIYNELLTYAFCAIPKRIEFCLLDLYDTLILSFYKDGDYQAFTNKVINQLIKQNQASLEVVNYLKKIKAKL